MNITLLSLISTSLLSNAPAFVNNHLSIDDCKFQKFIPLLFLNQKNLNLKNTVFSQGLGGIIYNDDERVQTGEHLTISGETFNAKYAPTSDTNLAITITECIFVNCEDGSLNINNNKISVYITSCLFNSCSAEGGIIQLQRSRCLTMTHTCTSNIYDKNGNGNIITMYYDCVQDDFSIILYNTFAQSQTKNTGGASNIQCLSGSQYFRCNNMTTCDCTAYQFDAPYCLSFSMNTVFDCKSRCLKLSGYKTDQCEIAFNKTIEKVNFFSTLESLYLEGDCPYTVTIQDSVLLSKDSTNLIYIQDGKLIKVVLISCIVNKGADASKVSFIDSSLVDYGTQHLTIMPHYTTELCPGTKLEKPPSALGCNEGNCIDKLCNKTIGFPDGVAKYTTILRTDINTPTPTETKAFSVSNEFSQSLKFTSSNPFNPTNKFTDSKSFTPSKKFSKSLMFTSSDKFTFSSGFSNSLKFTSSEKFTFSSGFSKSDFFSKSNKFTESRKFTHSYAFSKSDKFTQSKKFTESDHFTYSHTFTQSNNFDATKSFTPSDTFTSSDYFTKSSDFSKSTMFTVSDHFTQSSKFTASGHFTQSSKFTASGHFTLSSKFTDSLSLFKMSDPFSGSNEFSLSHSFSMSSVINGGNIGAGNRSSNNKKIGIIAGVAAAAAALIIGLLVFFFIRRRKKLMQTSDMNMLETNDTGITMENTLNSIMDEDDPFKNDF